MITGALRPIVLVACAVGAALVTEASAADYTAKLAYVAQPSNPFHTAMEFFAKKVAEKTNGAVEVKLFHSQQLGGERDYIEGLQLGTLEMTGVSTAPLAGFEPTIGLFSLPFLFRDSDHLDRVLDGPIGKQVADKFIPKGIRVLGYTDMGARYIHNAKRMIRTPEDMKGLKFRVMQNEVHLETYRALGARATPMARPEVYSALKQGVLDGLDNALAFYESMGDYEVAKYLTMGVQLLQTPGVIAVSERWYQGLGKELQAAIAAAAAETVPYQRKIFRAADDEILRRLKSKGVTVEAADPAPFAEKARAVWDKFGDKVGGQALIDAVVATP